MFDDLDDPNPVQVPAAARAAVGARVTRIRRRRTAWAAGGTSLALVLVAVGAGVGRGDERRGGDRVAQDGTGTPSPSPSPYETIDPSADPVTGSPATQRPRPSSTPYATRGGTTAPSSTPGPDDDPVFPGSRPDGKPGWSNGYGGCSVPTSLPAERDDLPFPFLSATFEFPTQVRGGSDVEGAVEIRNDGDRTVGFTVVGAVDVRARHERTGRYAAEYFSDAIPVHRVVIGPGESVELHVWFRAKVCGDTDGDDAPLPPGTYVAASEFRWENPSYEASGPPASATATATAGPGLPPRSEQPSPSQPPGQDPSPGPVAESGTWGSPRMTFEAT